MLESAENEKLCDIAAKQPHGERWAWRVLAARGGTLGQQDTMRLEATITQVHGAGKE